VILPAGDGVLAPTFLSRALSGSGEWRFGSVQVAGASQIGAEYGLSGRIHRVTVETERGGSLSIIVKQETAAAVERELLFRSHCGDLVRGCIPDLLYGATDDESGRGVLVLEDIAPAEQGDVLRGCTDDQAEAVVRVLARLHGGSWSATDDPDHAGLPRWRAHPMEPDRWRDRLDRASDRFPKILAQHVALLLDLPEMVAVADNALNQGPVSWLQVDAHLDNTLFRPDGMVVLLDWCNAAIGPPAVDLARFLAEGVELPPSERVTVLLSLYATELSGFGIEDVSVAELLSGFERALLPLLLGAVGWAGRGDLDLRGRPGAVCESFLRSLCAWTAPDDSGSHKGSREV
jgi:Phosphotransferase enzyme family